MNKIAGIILLVGSIEESAAFYMKLGFIVAEERSGIATIMSLGDFWVELLDKDKVVSEEYKDDANAANKGAGSYLQIQVEDVDDFYARIIANGVKVAARPQDYPWHHREITVVDPDGYKLTYFSKL